jgi:hypothetical protein
MDDCPLIMVSSDLDSSFVGAVRSRRDDVSAPTQTAVIGGRRPADPFGASRWVAMPGMATRNPAFLGGRDRPGHDGLVGMGAPDKEPARRRRRFEKIPPKHAVKAGVSP